MQTQTQTFAITNRQVPSILGLDPAMTRYRLWHLLKGDRPEIENAQRQNLSLVEALRPNLLAWIQERSQTFFKAPARFPDSAAQSRPDLPLYAIPDLILDSQPAWGQGPGVVRIFHMEHSEWHRLWHPAALKPQPSPAAAADLQMCMLAQGVEWGLALAVVGTRQVKSPLPCIPDPDARDSILSEITDFLQSLALDDSPKPDARSAPDVMAKLAEISAQPPGEGVSLSPEEGRLASSILKSYEETLTRLEGKELEIHDLRAVLEQNRVQLAELASIHGKFLLDGKSVMVRVEDLPPSAAKQTITLQIEEE